MTGYQYDERRNQRFYRAVRAGALTAESYDRFRCYALCQENAMIYTEFGSSYTNEDGTGAGSAGSEVCGKCVTGSPCAFWRLK